MPRRIPTHRPIARTLERRSYDRTPGRREDKAFYDSVEWRRLRAFVLAEEPLCRRCRDAGRIESAVHVHHVEARKDAPDRALDRSNLVALCQRCHNAVRHSCEPI